MKVKTNLEKHVSLEEAIRDKHVIRDGSDYSVSNLYWRWCDRNTKPFVAITIKSPRSRYATVEIDLFNTSQDGFKADAGYEIFRSILGQPLKPKSTFSISPIVVKACIAIDSVKPFADFLYQSALDEGSLLTPEEHFETITQRFGVGDRPKRAFGGFSADVHPLVLKELRSDNFWQLHVLAKE